MSVDSGPLSICICLPTYKRVHLLELLIADLTSQTIHPHALVVIDGDPASGEVLQMLANVALPESWRVVYLPSNHANLAYQRYLGWRAARDLGCDILLYFDDDLRLPQADTIEKLVAPFEGKDTGVVGITSRVVVGDEKHFAGAQAIRDSRNTLLSRAATKLGSSRRVSPGGLTPVGHRKSPAPNGREYVPVSWLQGRVMAYRMSALDRFCFSQDLFAIYSHRLGKGEDTFLSRQVGTKGTLLMAFNTYVEHPNADTPKAYPYQARRLAYATAYSRRFLNDHYRSPNPPTFSDRVALLKNYVGVTTFAWLRALTSFKAHRLAYAVGYTQGAIRGLIQKPTAKNLTPDIDWWADAEEALARRQILQEGEM